ncbi:MAG: hypothetical protein IJ485_01795 [Lachnospiraceae bacterium]|nr:hypothetical protein [Lachnospiraceae bacterium]
MKTKQIPLVLMLIAGAATSIITYIRNYELKDMLTILLLVLLVFYIVGLLIKKMFDTFQKELDAAAEAEREAAEGEVIEKDSNEEHKDQMEQKGQSEK